MLRSLRGVSRDKISLAVNEAEQTESNSSVDIQKETSKIRRKMPKDTDSRKQTDFWSFWKAIKECRSYIKTCQQRSSSFNRNSTLTKDKREIPNYFNRLFANVAAKL